MNPFERARIAADRHPMLVDALVATALAGLGVAGAVLTTLNLPGEDAPPVAAAIVLPLVLSIPLAWRRRYPLGVVVVTSAVFTVHRLVGVPEGAISAVTLFLALVSGGAYGRPRSRRDLVRGVALAALVLLLVVELWGSPAEDVAALLWLQVFSILFNLVFFVAAWVLGDLMRTRAEREEVLAERTRELEREREENARRAVVEERVRIARELHDVVAHHVSVMGVQAGAARRVLRSRPEKAEEALAAVEDTSRSAVGELQRLVGLLRQSADEESRAPRPGVRDLDRLAVQMREAGLPVDVVIHGPSHPLPATVDLSAYRIVQEALTNTLRHAGHAHASVEVCYGTEALEVEVRDDGRGPAVVGAVDHANGRGGHGIGGMRERVALLGGNLEVGANPGGGFRVRARLPLRAS